ncbi:glycosyltransferase family 4 protein [Streptomyces sp. NBC_00140]|uniref:glycosyltransferase family 4 protein n=1 Tax=Streptomyces sp. NBC_00140 TaxID=2975664 RepID=UPI002257FA26|nr:glycosyltransferase family 4 protein [Streptomyces sp. NBC_00140]MCX5335481.1 glycosyltransferase family 4 protein [Streptomyces sp. NBC_00140]MCX5338339.1 glycosyltransferase family 4 protein [Streptomyces sp. NBC_00140]
MTRQDVFGWMAGRDGCGTIRIMIPLAELRERGHSTGWSQRIDTSSLPRTLIGQRICNPQPTSGWQQVAAMPNRPKLVFEVDDNLWDIDYRSAKAHEFFNEDGVVDNLNANIKTADAVTVTTEALADLVRPLNPNVHIIPNYLPGWVLEHERPRRDGHVVIGWGGSNTHAMDLAEVGPQLRRYLDRAPAHVELHVMGEPKPPPRRRGVIRPHTPWTEQYRLPEDRIRWTAWNASVPDYWRAIDYDIMLAPLRPHPFNRSKSNLRVLEAAMLGIPAIATDYGPYADFVDHGVTGLLVKSDHDWGRHLRALVEDPAMRQEMGAAARAKAATWTIEGNADQWEKVLIG